ncbi:MAG: hypothetical protein E3J67_03950 [Dehalococcoidia bacterium]|nr:MAG: hypothetical protein E3J67_03950 [Dehalococcoidia bacterium]
MNYRLSPSDLTFLYQGCKRCFYFKVVDNIYQPSIPLPGIFTKMAALLKDYYTGKHTRELHIDIPPGTVDYGERRVKSKPIQLPGHSATCFISGRFDIVVNFEDGTYGVIDFKTGNPNEEYAQLYSRQLHAYAYALENAAPGTLALSPVTKMGLLYFHPSAVSQQRPEQLSYEADITWIEIEKNKPGFLKFVAEVLDLLESPQPPPPSPYCPWCSYVSNLRNSMEKSDA